MKARTFIAVLGAVLVALLWLFIWVVKKNKQKRQEAVGKRRALARKTEDQPRLFNNPLFLKIKKSHANKKWLSAGRRAQLLGALKRAQDRRLNKGTKAAAAPPSGKAVEPPPGVLDKDYIKKQIREILPLLKECYELALHDNPDVTGKLTVKFVIVGEPELGGLVEQSDIIESRGLPEKTILTECVRETMYALEFEPPANGGRVTVKYPFTFRKTGKPRNGPPESR